MSRKKKENDIPTLTIYGIGWKGALILFFVLLVIFIPMVPYTPAVEPDLPSNAQKLIEFFTAIKNFFLENALILLLVGGGIFLNAQLKK